MRPHRADARCCDVEAREECAHCGQAQLAYSPTTMSESIKGPAPPPTKLDGSPLRVAIVHSRWNKSVIDALVAGTIAKLKATGVKDTNIVVQSVPGSFELPLACAKCVEPISTVCAC